MRKQSMENTFFCDTVGFEIVEDGKEEMEMCLESYIGRYRAPEQSCLGPLRTSP